MLLLVYKLINKKENDMKYIGTTFEMLDCGVIVTAIVTKHDDKLYSLSISGDSTGWGVILNEADLEECIRVYTAYVATYRRAVAKEDELAKKNAIKEHKFNNSMLGKFLATKSKMQAGKCKKTLETLARYNGDMSARHEWCESNYTTRTVEGRDVTSTVTNGYFTLTKTECDYLEFLQDNA